MNYTPLDRDVIIALRNHFTKNGQDLTTSQNKVIKLEWIEKALYNAELILREKERENISKIYSMNYGCT